MRFEQRAGIWLLTPAWVVQMLDKPLSTKSLPGVQLNVQDPGLSQPLCSGPDPPLAAWIDHPLLMEQSLGIQGPRFPQIWILGGFHPGFSFVQRVPPFPSHPTPYLPEAPHSRCHLLETHLISMRLPKPEVSAPVLQEWIGQESEEAGDSCCC